MLPASVEDRDFILSGVKDGFKLSVIYGPHLPVDRDNYTSAFRFRSPVEKQIKWGSPTIFTLIGGACVPSVITFGTPRLVSIT